MTAPALEASIARVVAAQEERGAIPPGTGIAVVVATREGPIAYAAHGLRDREHGLPVTTKTRFELGSLTKAVTAMAVLQATADGAWSLSAPSSSVSTRFPLRDPDVASRVSIEDMLSHRTGLPPHNPLWYFAATGSSPRQITGRLGHLALIPNGFRRIFSYNNLAYGALGVLFEDVLGQSWESFVRERIFEPLELRESWLGTGVDATEREVATGYAGAAPIPRKDLGVVAPAGAWRGNVEELGRWLAFQLGDGATASGARLSSSESLRAMRTERIAVEKARSPLLFQGLEWLGESVGYGLGWFLGALHGHRALYHPAYIDGFSGVAALVPDLDVAVAVVCNQNASPAPGLIAREIVAHLTGLPLSEEPAPDPAAPEHDAPGPVEGTAATLAEGIEGRYTNAAYGSIDMLRSGAGLAVRYGDYLWPAALDAAGCLVVTIHAFGFDIPLPSSIERDGTAASAIEIPLALEPLAPAVRFSRG